MQFKTLFFLLLLTTGFTFSTQAQEGFIGEVRLFAGDFAPRGWAYCNGQQLAIREYQSLYAIIGNRYGGDGRTTFALPKLNGADHLSATATAGSAATPNLRSKPGGSPITVTFTNRTKETASAYWIDWDGKAIFYGSIAPGQNWTVNSGTRQYWRFTHGTRTITDVELVGTKTLYNIEAQRQATPTAASTASGTKVNYIICVSGVFPSRN